MYWCWHFFLWPPPPQHLFASNSPDPKSRTRIGSVFMGSLFSCQNIKTPARLSHMNQNQTKQMATCPPYQPAGDCVPLTKREQLSLDSLLLAEKTHVCHSQCQNITVVNQFNNFVQEVATEPGWLFFSSTTASCYKSIGGRVWYFEENCTRDTIVDFAFKNEWVCNCHIFSEMVPRALDCSLTAVLRRTMVLCCIKRPVRKRHTSSSHHFATQSSHFVDHAGWQAKMAYIEVCIPWRNASKWLPLKFVYHDVMHQNGFHWSLYTMM